MSIEIKHISGKVLFASDRASVRYAIEEAREKGADLGGADLRGAYLGGADLGGAKNADLAIARTRILPDGDLIGWKKSKEGHIVKLRIPADARRTHGVGRKCRAERAEVVAIYAGSDEVATAQSCYDPKFQYVAGAVVTPREPFNDDMWKECASGIHFYITRPEAEAHI